MSQTGDSTAVTPTEHPRVFHESPTIDKEEFELAKRIADTLETEWRVIVTSDSFRPHTIIYRINPDMLDVDFVFYRINVESRLVNFHVYSVRAYGIADIENAVCDINLEYGMLDVKNDIYRISLKLHNAIQDNSWEGGILYETDIYEEAFEPAKNPTTPDSTGTQWGGESEEGSND
jgi:hypothetical protein